VGPMLVERTAREIPGGRLLLEGQAAPAGITLEGMQSIGKRIAARIRQALPWPLPEEG
jgi:hypothetical protein